jgi:hypothetical protein
MNEKSKRVTFLGRGGHRFMPAYERKKTLDRKTYDLFERVRCMYVCMEQDTERDNNKRERKDKRK